MAWFKNKKTNVVWEVTCKELLKGIEKGKYPDLIEVIFENNSLTKQKKTKKAEEKPVEEEKGIGDLFEE